MIKTALVFGDHMVIQREKPFVIWGSAVPGAKLSVHVQRSFGETVADQEGNWKLTLPPLHTSREETLVIACGEERLEFRHVAVGEVWIAGGQSNMEFYMRYDREVKEERKTCENPLIRFFDYPEVRVEEELDRLDFSRFGYWRPCTPEDLEYYSAVGYYFARRLSVEMEVPVGILACNWGGSKACCWMDEAYAEEYAAEALKEYRETLSQMEDIPEKERFVLESPLARRDDPFHLQPFDRMNFGLTPEELGEVMKELAPILPRLAAITPVHEWRPCGLFHTMLEKIIPYAARGVIWYQGESDQFFAEHYAKMLTGVIHCWRNSWNDELPFLISHLAPLAATAGGKNFEVIRAQQEQVARELQGVCTVPIDDIGEEFALHPRTKRPVGERLAGVALQEIYGKSKNAFAPAFSRYMRLGSAIRLSFTDAEGLCTPNLDEEPFAIQAGESTVPKELYQLSMENGEVLIRLDDRLAVKRLSIHFASAGYCKVQLKNRFGLPVKPFMVNV